MSVDRTLHIRSGGTMKRNVLSRAERIAMLAEGGEVDLDALSPLGLAKTKLRVSKAGTKSKKEEKPAEGAAAEGAPAAEGAAPAAGKEAKPAAKEAKGAKAEAKPAKAEAKGKGKK